MIAPIVVGVLGALFERYCLRRVHKFGHVPELLITFGLSFVILELVHARSGAAPRSTFRRPPSLRGPAFTLINSSVDGLRVVWGAAPAAMCQAADATVRVVCSPFPATRGFMMLVALLMLVALWLLLTRTRIGLVIQSALTHPEMVESLGHNVPRVFMLVFGGGCGARRSRRRDRRHHVRHRAGDGGDGRRGDLRRRRRRRHGLARRRVRRVAADRRDPDLRRRARLLDAQRRPCPAHTALVGRGRLLAASSSRSRRSRRSCRTCSWF